MSYTKSLIEKSLIHKWRYKVPGVGGEITTEGLYDLNLNKLDDVAGELDKSIREAPRASFVSDTPNPELLKLQEKFEVVLRVISYKKYLEQVAKEAADLRPTREKAAQILERRKTKHLANLPDEDLQKIIAQD
jgi:BioD-like phosphotransacetylase family protein